MVLSEVNSDETFAVATNASLVGIAVVLLQDRGVGLQPVSNSARKLYSVERGNSYSTDDLEALVVREALEMLP
jgi:hypothetical protein